ncbi:MAG: histidine ammonia-lyase [Candidatus Kapaibacterium sp.]|nr:MAG: histidine ammonia-lyase [Candidatus Kapabacteria bacterium]
MSNSSSIITVETLLLDGYSLTLDDVVRAASGNVQLALAPEARERMITSRRLVERWLSRREVVYGVTTGFGELASVTISPEDVATLQENLIISHSAGAGDYLPPEVVRAMMLLRINALAKGYSGVRPELVEHLVDVFNAGIIPAVPEQGSVGSSGDLVQLAHIALALIGKGWCMTERGAEPSALVLAMKGLRPIQLQAKEGLALINGTQYQCAVGALVLARALDLADVADVAGAFSADVLRSTDRAFDERIHRVRGLRGQQIVAAHLRALMAGSQIRESHRTNDPRVQDAYSIRCMPQVHGASRDALAYVQAIIEAELNAANDNPLIFPEGEHLEGGNFHGQPLAIALDTLAIAVAELANISERRIERMVNGALSNGLPKFLATNPGLESGMMIAQYTAASLVSENKVLAHPASVDSIPTSANQEDHNSMGSIAAWKARRIVSNTTTVLAIELLCAARALDFLRPLRTSETLERVHSAIRDVVPDRGGERVLYRDIQAVRILIEDGIVAALGRSGWNSSQL